MLLSALSPDPYHLPQVQGDVSAQGTHLDPPPASKPSSGRSGEEKDLAKSF